ncbi:MAG: polysulfide reductase NrfD [Rhodospirillales bacterium]|nr:polysulfide reductase NrfD [Rhodospirillales bacterium]
MRRTTYREITGQYVGFYGLMAGLGVLILLSLAAAWHMEHQGHHVTGMTNQIVWGMPHVLAIFLIVAASGALNVASIGTVFGRTWYKPLGRLSGLLALALLVGGLAVLVLDLGRADRILVAMTTYNFKSIFAWNIYLYTGFMAVVVVYLWVQMERRMNRFAPAAGLVAMIWRLVLTTGTGSIFGFLVARQAYDAAVMAPLFIAMSLSLGLACFNLTLAATCRGTDLELGDGLVSRLGRLLGVLAAVVLYFTAVQHLANLYAAEHAGIERFILLEGGVFTALFWLGQVVLGGLVPIALVFTLPAGRALGRVLLASILVFLGGIAQIYVIVIGGQAYPLVLFPGKEVQSSFFDGVVMSYAPSWPEITLSVGGFAMAAVIVMVGLRALRFLPESLADAALDPHHSAAPTGAEEKAPA